VTDKLTGLIWLQDANCPGGTKTWQQSLDWVASFNSGSPACTKYSAGTFSDWRLPSIKELLSLVDYGQSDPALPSGSTFLSVQLSSFYWSSTSDPANPISTWTVLLTNGSDLRSNKAVTGFVWPVRGGQ